MLETHFIKQSNWSLFSEQPKSVVHACPMVYLWNFSMSMTPTWATAQPKRSGLWLTHAAGGQKSAHSVSKGWILHSKISVFQRQQVCVRSEIVCVVPTSRPPLEPPLIVSLLGEVYPSFIRYSAAHWKSVKQFCLFANIPPGEQDKRWMIIFVQIK